MGKTVEHPLALTARPALQANFHFHYDARLSAALPMQNLASFNTLPSTYTLISNISVCAPMIVKALGEHSVAKAIHLK